MRTLFNQKQLPGSKGNLLVSCHIIYLCEWLIYLGRKGSFQDDDAKKAVHLVYADWRLLSSR